MTKLTDFKPDPNNLNKGSERGNYALERSIREYGFARPVVAAADGTILAGNHAYAKAGEIGLNKVRVIETTGDEIIVHKRMDLDSESAKARMVALADNRTTEINLSWDSEGLKELADATADVSNFFVDTELDDFLLNKELEPTDFDPYIGDEEGDEEAEVDEVTKRESGTPQIAYTVVFDDEEQQENFHSLLRYLKKLYPEVETLGARLDIFLNKAVDVVTR